MTSQTQLLLTVLVGILLNRNDYSKLDGRLTAVADRLDARIGGVENRLDGRMTALESRFHADMLMLIGKVTELDVRVTKLEGK